MGEVGCRDCREEGSAMGGVGWGWGGTDWRALYEGGGVRLVYVGHSSLLLSPFSSYLLCHHAIPSHRLLDIFCDGGCVFVFMCLVL